MTPAELQQRAQAGDGDAAVMLSRLLDRDGRHGEALAWLDRAAGAGHVLAGTLLGARYAAARAAPHDPARGAQLLAAAADAGGADAAAYAAVLAATGVGRPQSWDDAVALTERAAALGHARA